MVPLWANSKSPGFPPCREPVKGAFFIIEQFTLKELFGNRRAIYGDKGPLAIWGKIMKAVAYNFLPRAGFTDYQNSGVGNGVFAGRRYNRLHPGRGINAILYIVFGKKPAG